MADFYNPEGPTLLILGYGAAGRAYAEGFAPYARVAASDPFAGPDVKRAAQAHDIILRNDIPETLDDFDLIIILSPAHASLSICERLASRPGTCPVLDLTSSEPAAMHAAAALLGTRLVDGAVFGAVGLTGLATPMVFAGPKAADIASILKPLGCRVTCLSGAPGAASTLKLLRSLFMKGLEALVIETNLTATALGQTNSLELAFSDLADGNIIDLMAEMLRTHPRHAGRRKQEILAADGLMRNAGLTPVMTQAALSIFGRTETSGKGPDHSPEAALDWLWGELKVETGAHT